jgi:hypothetical protein
MYSVHSQPLAFLLFPCQNDAGIGHLLLMGTEVRMEGVRLDGEELIRTYGVTRRLAVRVGALLAKGLAVTPTILEIAGPGSPLEKLLLHSDLLQSADSISSEALCALAEATHADSEGPLVIVDTDDGRVLALEEELLAEEGWEQSDDELSLAQRDEDLSVAPILDRSESEKLFSGDEIARLKLEALAGRDAEARISAVRKLLYSPLSPHEKGSIFLRALSDSAAEVRGEAIKALESLGFNRDTADAIRMVFDGGKGEQEKAISRIRDLLERLEPAERHIVLLVLVDRFREASMSKADEQLLDILTDAVPLVAPQEQTVREIVRLCVQHIVVGAPIRGGGMGASLRALLMRLAECAPGTVLAKLWDEVDTVTDTAQRAALLGLLIDLEHEPGAVEMLCGRVVDLLLDEGLDELPRQDLGHALVARGELAARVLHGRFAQATTEGRTRLVSFLDAACMDGDLPEELRGAIMEAMVTSVKVADRRLQEEILRTRVFNQHELPHELRRSLAEDLTPLLRTVEHADLPERVAMLLETLGDAAAEGLFDLMQMRPTAEEADRAARTLAEILAQSTADSPARKLVGAVMAFCRKCIASKRNPLGGYAFALGRIATAGLVSADAARDIYEALSQKQSLARYPADAVGAIGRLAAGSDLTDAQRIEAVHLLGALIDRPPDEEKAAFSEVLTKEGVVYEVTGEVDFDSDTLPAAVRGLSEIAISDGATDALREQILDLLLRVWDGVASWRTVWGPRSSEELARSLAVIGTAETASDAMRVRVLDALAVACERLSVLRGLALLFECASDDATFNKRVLDVAHDVLQHWIDPDTTADEMTVVLGAVGRAAARNQISSRTKKAKYLRKETATLLYGFLNSGEDWARQLLETLRDCKSTPKALREEIAHRLKMAFSLVK